jgi:hypothetical protein
METIVNREVSDLWFEKYVTLRANLMVYDVMHNGMQLLVIYCLGNDHDHLKSRYLVGTDRWIALIRRLGNTQATEWRGKVIAKYDIVSIFNEEAFKLDLAMLKLLG